VIALFKYRVIGHNFSMIPILSGLSPGKQAD